MAENFYDSAATHEQNVAYLKDPADPASKPYSSKQKAANEAHKGRVWLYHKQHGSRIFEADDIALALNDGWVDTPFVHPNNPDHVAPEIESGTDSEIDLLRSELDANGIKYDKRWGKDKLQQALLKGAA